MRMHLSTSWVLLGAMFSIVAADEPTFQFDGTTFKGVIFKGEISETQSSVFKYQNLSAGTQFRFDQTGTEVKIVRVDLMSANNLSIFSWCFDHDCDTVQGFDVHVNHPTSEILLNSGVIETLHQYLNVVLFFRVDWQYKNGGNGKRDAEKFSAYSQDWAIVDGDDDAGEIFSSFSLQMTAGADPARPTGPAPTSFNSAVSSTTSQGTTASTATTSMTTSATAGAGSSGSKSGGLSTGAIVGIVVGCVGGVILVSVVAGCLCFRRRRNGAGDDRGGSRGVQDIAAEKEAHASILDKDQPDTPYSEHNSQHPLNRGLGLAGRNESGVDLGGIGQAVSRENRGSIHTESVHTVGVGNDRSSAVYSSLAGGAATPSHGTPVIGSRAAFAGGPAQVHTPPVSVHDRGSAVGSPVPRASSQLDRSLSPYRDGAGPAQQEQHPDDSATARSPSSLYSNPLDEMQPISPESARDNDGAVGGSGGGGVGTGGDGASSSQPPGNGRSNTPSGIAQQYAHLVEEGMTEDEIRRLEEEERALDAAIAERRR